MSLSRSKVRGMMTCMRFRCSKRRWIRCWGYEMLQAFFVLDGKKVVVVRDGDVIAVDVEWVEGAFQQPVGTIAHWADHFKKSYPIRLAYQFAQEDRVMGIQDRQHRSEDGDFKTF